MQFSIFYHLSSKYLFIYIKNLHNVHISRIVGLFRYEEKLDLFISWEVADLKVVFFCAYLMSVLFSHDKNEI